MNAHKIIIEKSKSVTTESNGIIGVNPKKPEFGSIQLATTTRSFGGFMNKSRTVHFLSGRVEELKELVDEFSLSVGDDFSKKVQPSRLIVKESVTPFYDGQDAKINPTSGEVVTFQGEDIYRETALVGATSLEMDSKLSNDKVGATAGAESPFVEDNEGLTA